MSHGIRTPPGATPGMAWPLQQGPLDPMQRLQAGELHVESVPFSLDEVLDHVGNLLGVQAAERGLELLYDCDDDLPVDLVGDRLGLGQVLLKLGHNAIRFTPRGEVCLAIRVLRRDDHQVQLRFSVQDSGIGLTPQQRERLFPPFVQADGPTGCRDGSPGPGLALCRHLIERMGGTIDVDSLPGVGSTFHVALRFELAPARAAAGAPADGRLAGERVLVLGDHARTAEVLARMVGALGMRPDTERDLESALRALVSADRAGAGHALVLVDAAWPVDDGLALPGWIDRLAWSGRRPAVVLLAPPGPPERLERLAERGARVGAVVSKPVRAAALDAACREALDRVCAPACAVPAEKPLPFLGTEEQRRLRGRRVLLVEDHPLNRELAAELLARGGLQVTTAGDGREALARLEVETFDLVLMDCRMPELDGYAATRELRARSDGRWLPVIAMTADATAGDRDRALGAGMNDHVPKPIRPRQLYDTLMRWLPPAPA